MAQHGDQAGTQPEVCVGQAPLVILRHPIKLSISVPAALFGHSKLGNFYNPLALDRALGSLIREKSATV